MSSHSQARAKQVKRNQQRSMLANHTKAYGRCKKSAMLLEVSMTLGCVGNPPCLPRAQEGQGCEVSTEAELSDEGQVNTMADVSPQPFDDVDRCGNEVVEPGEDCDGTKLGYSTCEALGHMPGELRCGEACKYDVSGCAPPGMALVPAGDFEMGGDVYERERPIRMVYVDSFYIDKTEVTVDTYAHCVEARMCTIPGTDSPLNFCNWEVSGRGNHPINCVDWEQAKTFCEWRETLLDPGQGHVRLPTEAEWEKAARGTDGREYPWGDMPFPSCDYVVMGDPMGESISPLDGCEMLSTWEVGSKPLGASPYGALDMSGNVWEWVRDWYDDSGYDPEQTDNPIGPESSPGEERVIRGASWNTDDYQDFRTMNRDGDRFDYSSSVIGFRCIRTMSNSQLSVDVASVEPGIGRR